MQVTLEKKLTNLGERAPASCILTSIMQMKPRVAGAR